MKNIPNANIKVSFLKNDIASLTFRLKKYRNCRCKQIISRLQKEQDKLRDDLHYEKLKYKKIFKGKKAYKSQRRFNKADIS